MARRRRKKDSGGNLDSLLDTMTSVVGILIIILIVIQIGVKEKVKELVLENAGKEVSLIEIQEKQKEVESLNKLIEQKVKNFLKNNHTYKTGMKEVKSLEKELNSISQKLLVTKAAKADPVKINQDLSKALKGIKETEAKLQDVEADEKKLKNLLDAYKRKKKSKADAKVKMPEPRPAPPGARAVYFVCKDNRILYVDENSYRDYFKKKLDQARIKPNKQGEYHYPTIEKNFSRRSNITPFGKFEMFATKVRVLFKLSLSRSIGESANYLTSRNSKFQKTLSVLGKNKYYIVFKVSPDNYSVYLKARYIAEKMGYSCGWAPIAQSEWDHVMAAPLYVIGGKKAEAEWAKNGPKKPNNVLD